MIETSKVKQAIEKAIPGSKASVTNAIKDGQHYEINVQSDSFKGKSLVEQHKMVHDSIKELRQHMHAVVIHTELSLEKKPRKENSEKTQKETREGIKSPAANLKEMVREAIAHNDVTVFIKGPPSQPLCGFSAKVVYMLNELGVKYKSVNIFDDVMIKPTLVEMTGWPTTPQVFIKGTLIGGCDITEEMYASGELQKILKDAKILA